MPTTSRSSIITEETVMAKKRKLLDYDLRMVRRTAGDAIEAQVRVRAA